LTPEVVAAARELSQSRRISLSAAVNSLAEAGLARSNTPAPTPFAQPVERMGAMVDVSNVADALDLLDGPAAP
jgi:hypothetical protein